MNRYIYSITVTVEAPNEQEADEIFDDWYNGGSEAPDEMSFEVDAKTHEEDETIPYPGFAVAPINCDHTYPFADGGDGLLECTNCGCLIDPNDVR